MHPIKTFALTFKEEKVFTYTGDTNFCPQVERLFNISDVVLCDACFLQENWVKNKPHMNVNGICELSQKFATKAILTHLNPQTDKEKYINEAFGDYHLAQIGDKIII
jgi:ribonuclease BN (tRNA processing enzyme)